MTPYAEEVPHDIEAPYAIPVGDEQDEQDERYEQDEQDQRVHTSQLSKCSALCCVMGICVCIFTLAMILYLMTMYLF